MQTQMESDEQSSGVDLIIKMVLDAWETYNARFNQLMKKLSDEELSADTAPGRNSGIYLAGHLVAVHDGMLPLLGFGDKFYPELENIFLTNPDKSGLEMPSIVDLKKYQEEVNAKFAMHMAQLQPRDWFAKHGAASTEDFAKGPHRNKLNIIINRTNHLSYHLGQLAYLVKRN